MTISYYSVVYLPVIVKQLLYKWFFSTCINDCSCGTGLHLLVGANVLSDKPLIKSVKFLILGNFTLTHFDSDLHATHLVIKRNCSSYRKKDKDICLIR